MTNTLGNFFRNRRIEKGLSLGQLARLARYKNTNKGVRRILHFEHYGTITDGLLVTLAEALEIDWNVVEELAEQDWQERRRAWESWASEPIPMYMVVRYMAAIYGQHVVPNDIQTADEAEEYACDYARQHRWRVCLVLSRRRCVWISASGEVERREEAGPDQLGLPISHVRGDRRPLWFDPSG